MKNSKIRLTNNWEIVTDNFLDIDPLDKSIDFDVRDLEVFCTEDLFLIRDSDYNLDLGWYGRRRFFYTLSF